MRIQSTSTPLIVAHRGASAYQPANTLAAFQLAVEQQADFIELDVHLSKDDHIVVYHNWYIKIENRRIPLAELTLDEIRQNANLSKNEEQDAPLVPIFEDLINWFGTTSIGMIIEIKNCPIQYPSLPEKLIKKIKNNKLLEKSYIVSFDHNVIAGLKESLPEIHTGILYVARLANLRETIRFLNIDWLETPTDYLTSEIVDLAHQEKVKVCSWSTNDQEEIKRLCELEVDFITTDQPDRIRSYISDSLI